jgi:hypothetical protein
MNELSANSTYGFELWTVSRMVEEKPPVGVHDRAA